MRNSKEINEKVKLLRSHGVTKENLQNKSEGSWYYEQHSIGYNFRMSDIQSALGISQLKNLKTFLSKRNRIAKIYHQHLKNLPIKFQKVEKNLYFGNTLYFFNVKKLSNK